MDKIASVAVADITTGCNQTRWPAMSHQHYSYLNQHNIYLNFKIETAYLYLFKIGIYTYWYETCCFVLYKVLDNGYVASNLISEKYLIL